MSIEATIVGRVGAAEDRDIGGRACRSLRIATEHYDRRAGERVTTWVGVLCWPGQDGRVTGPAGWAQKGDLVVATGELHVREHEGRTYHDLERARVIHAAPVARRDEAGQAPPPAAAGDDIPF